METIETTTMTPLMPGRPTFLTVLCILTFIWSGWNVMKSIHTYFTADAAAAMVSEKLGQEEDQVNSSNTPGFVQSIFNGASKMTNPSALRKSSLISLLGYLLTLSGAIVMWMLKKPGFYLYILGILVLITIPVLLIGGMLGAITGGGEAFIGLVFIIMYGVNVKYMS